MSEENSFVVKNPKILFQMSACMNLVFLGIWVIQAVSTMQLHLALLITIMIVLVIPFSVLGIWGKRYCIKVKGRSIFLQRAFRIRSVSFDVSEIEKVLFNITETRAGLNMKITVYTPSCGKFTVETLMSNFDKMKEYLEEYTGSVIETKHKKMGV